MQVLIRRTAIKETLCLKQKLPNWHLEMKEATEDLSFPMRKKRNQWDRSHFPQQKGILYTKIK